MNHRTGYPIVQGLLASLIAICFSSCSESGVSTDDTSISTSTDTSTDTSTENTPDSAIDTAATGTDTASDADTNSDSDTDNSTETGTDTDTDTGTETETGSNSDMPTDMGTDTTEDVTDTASNASGNIIQAYTFDDGWEDFYAGGTNDEMAEWTHNPTDGTLDVVFEYSGRLDAALVKKIVVVYSEESDWLALGEDWSEATEIVYRLRVDEAPVGAVQPFILTGEGTEWCAEWIELVEDDNYRDYTLHIDVLNGTEGPRGGLIDISDVREVGLEINIGPRMEEFEPGETIPTIDPGTIRLSLDSIIVK